MKVHEARQMPVVRGFQLQDHGKHLPVKAVDVPLLMQFHRTIIRYVSDSVRFQLPVDIFLQMFAPDAKQALPRAGLGEINGFAGALHEPQRRVVADAEDVGDFSRAVEPISNEALKCLLVFGVWRVQCVPKW